LNVKTDVTIDGLRMHLQRFSNQHSVCAWFFF